MASARHKFTVIPGKLFAGPSKSELTAKNSLKNDLNSNATAQTEYVETLYRKYHNSLLSYLMRIIPGGRAQDASEILQETYLRLLKQETLDHLEQNARAYIFTIATNLVYDLHRRSTSRMQDLHIELDEVTHASGTPSPPRVTEWEISLHRLKHALLDLKPLTRKIFLLSRFEQMTYPEISSKLQISTRTVERHMSTAFKQLQTALADLS